MRLETIPEIAHWRPVTNAPGLPPGALHLWRIRTGNGGAPLADLWPLLSQGECERAKRLRLTRHRERHVRAHAGLRAILASYVSVDPQYLVFKYGNSGKPALDVGKSDVEFNLTTSGDLALVAVSRLDPVGIDSEQARERKELVAIAHRMFTPEEVSRIAAAGQQDRSRLFHLAWTALEARVKADGRGLFHCKEPAAGEILDIRHCVPEPGFIAAVARRNLPPIKQWKTLELSAG